MNEPQSLLWSMGRCKWKFGSFLRREKSFLSVFADADTLIQNTVPKFKGFQKISSLKLTFYFLDKGFQ